VVTVADESNLAVDMTLWDDQAKLDWPVGTVFVAKNVRTSDYGTLTLSLGRSGSITIDPQDTPELAQRTADLHKWIQELSVLYGQGHRIVTKLSTAIGARGINENEERRSLSLIRDENMGKRLNPANGQNEWDILTTRAWLTMVKAENMSYRACAACNRKVTQSDDGQSFRCDNPNCGNHGKQLTHEQAAPRYIVYGEMADHTNCTGVSVFNEAARQLFGMEASEMEAQDTNIPGSRMNTIKTVMHHSYVARLKVREEMVNDETRLKVNVSTMERSNFLNESRHLLNDIGTYARMPKKC
jgi:DNA-directed RNA polymerase subunit RPC12/RpoP